jgi:hypothetical protein
MVEGKGFITFTHNNKAEQSVTYPLILKNGLWFYIYDTVTDDFDQMRQPIVKRMSTAGMYDLYHARLGHPGERTMSIIHLHVDGIPKLTKPSV